MSPEIKRLEDYIEVLQFKALNAKNNSERAVQESFIEIAENVLRAQKELEMESIDNGVVGVNFVESKGFQIRHKVLGVYQGGDISGNLIWTKLSPQHIGISHFKSREEAERFIQYLISDRCQIPTNIDDLNIEPFDNELSYSLLKSSDIWE